jgi:hypothetical protein
MSELPDRPDLDQLRRRARELLRAAMDGQPDAVRKIRAVSDRVMLATAQLAVARDYGYRSWPALKAEVERRRLSASLEPESLTAGLPAPGVEAGPAATGGDAWRASDALTERWSFGGATPIVTSVGLLAPQALIVAADHAVLHASLTPAEGSLPAAPAPRRMPAPAWPYRRWARRRHARAATATMRAIADQISEVNGVDASGREYALRTEAFSGRRGRTDGEPRSPMSVQLRLDPVPGRDVGWLEIRSQEGTATRLQPSPRPLVRLGQLTPVPMDPAERTLSDQARWLIQLRLTTNSRAAGDLLRPNCAATLATMAQIQRSGQLEPGSDLPDHLRQLCAVLADDAPAVGLPPSWSGMLDAAGAADGPPRHFDIGATLLALDGITVHVDSLFSEPKCWRLYLRAVPGWWEYTQDRQRKRDPVSVLAGDDRRNSYLSVFGGSTGAPQYEELALQFLPRLDPLARSLTLTFQGTREQLTVDLRLDATAAS